MNRKKTTAILLAAGTGKRMKSSTAKQYLLLSGKPILYYSLKAFEESTVDEIILVVGKNEIEYCEESLIKKYNFKKVTRIIEGGKERYHSVFHGLKEIKSADKVLIHDGVRPFITVDIIEEAIRNLDIYGACVVGVPSKDTIKLVNSDGIVKETPDRNKVWSVQTPQAFTYDIIYKAYCMIMDKMAYNREEISDKVSSCNNTNDNPNGFSSNDFANVNDNKSGISITDDAMVVEYTLNYPVRMIMGSYSNIKITTPEDILIGEALLKGLY
jgi:2-C-methyl-D-erythritol 4-phosphate cytidylyltransferase